MTVRVARFGASQTPLNLVENANAVLFVITTWFLLGDQIPALSPNTTCTRASDDAFTFSAPCENSTASEIEQRANASDGWTGTAVGVPAAAKNDPPANAAESATVRLAADCSATVVPPTVARLVITAAAPIGPFKQRERRPARAKRDVGREQGRRRRRQGERDSGASGDDHVLEHQAKPRRRLQWRAPTRASTALSQ